LIRGLWNTGNVGLSLVDGGSVCYVLRLFHIFHALQHTVIIWHLKPRWLFVRRTHFTVFTLLHLQHV